MTREVENILNELERTGFFGSLEIKYEGGRVTIMKKVQTIKPSTTQDYRNNREGTHEYQRTS